MNRVSLRVLLACVSVAAGLALASISTPGRAETTTSADTEIRSHAFDRPNILWITIEDWSPDLSCYGTKGIQTPHVDKLAAEGVRYDRAFTTSPVCSTSRSAMMTGFHQNFIGAHQHRTTNKQPLPYGIRPVPHLFADAGYFTCLMSRKTDVNFLPDKKEELFQGNDWSEREADQPFFARITFGGTHRAWNRDPVRPIALEDVELPPYYPDTPFIRRDWANGLEQMQLVDREVGELLKRLDDEGLSDNTLVFFIGDHGRCHIRGKQFLYDEGTRIPMIMRWPGKVQPGQVNDDLVMSIDICATILEAAGIPEPVSLHGKSLFSDDIKQRQYVFAARDKMDAAHDAMRSIRSDRYKLILNLMPERAYCQFSRYKEECYPPLAELNVLNLEGKLTAEQAAFMAPNKPAIEMFDLRHDPHELHNLADDPKLAKVKSELLTELEKWRRDVIKDQGVSDEFRAVGIFPKTCPTSTVGQWVQENGDVYDFEKNGYPAWYPTRTLEEWRAVKALWEPYVFRDPDNKVARPSVPYTKKLSKKKNTK
ncbi:sulfatase family protein [Neorhodopirellula lusitana]|uniref:sulfatase family protein n=1 Tax=Neorhodopirellula lusitana TaxID=445327 RepID=UPI00384EA322